jgi:hypothetical protein
VARAVTENPDPDELLHPDREPVVIDSGPVTLQATSGTNEKEQI